MPEPRNVSLDPDAIVRARSVGVDSVLAKAGIQLRRQGRELIGPCPRCGGNDRFQVHPAKGLFFCRQCNPRGGDVIALAMHIHGFGFADALEMLTGARLAQNRRKPAQTCAPRQERDDAEKLAYADAIWRQAVPIAGTPGEAYLRDRGIALEEVPGHGGLRFHAACPYGLATVPCVIARYTDILTGADRGIRRRPIIPGTAPKDRACGPVGSAVIRLWPDEDVAAGLVIGEGVETVLAAATRIEHRSTLLRPAWACGSAGTLESFPVLPGIEALTIVADNDSSGRGQEAAERCADRWADAGLEVTILTPRDLGDMNDIVRRAAA
jgi:phage/plasmid primase-like uncharacterized protein